MHPKKQENKWKRNVKTKDQNDLNRSKEQNYNSKVKQLILI